MLFLSIVGNADAGSIVGSRWRPIGPAPMDGFFVGGDSGRATAIAVNPFNGDEVWLGTAQGGLWWTPDAGNSWTPMTDDQAALAIGAIALDGCDPTGCAKVYAGTGENAVRRDTYYGRGMLIGTRQPSGAYTWVLREGDPSMPFTNGAISDVVLLNEGMGELSIYVIFTAGVTTSSSQTTYHAPPFDVDAYGLYKSTDDGVNWSRVVIPGSASFPPSDLKKSPAGDLYLGFTGHGIYKQDAGSSTWCPKTEGLAPVAGCPTPSGLPETDDETFDHVEIALVPDDPLRVYASLGRCPDPLFAACLPSVYRSNDGGTSWDRVVTGSSDNSVSPRGYSRYTHALAVTPDDPNVLLMGLVDVNKLTVEPPPSVASSFMTVYTTIHSDHREIVFDPTDPTRAYGTNDGGFAVLMDDGTSMSRNDDLQITGFQSLTSGSALAPRLIGGAQDNGGLTWDGTSGRRWRHMNCCGDGGFSVISAVDPTTYYVNTNFGKPRVSFDQGRTWCSSGNLPTTETSEPRAMYAPLVQSPLAPHDLYLGWETLYRGQISDDACDGDVQPAVSWFAINVMPPNADGIDQICPPGGGPRMLACGNVITAIGLAPTDPDRIYVGYFGGQVLVTSNATASPFDVAWTDITGGIGTQPITRIAVHPEDPDRIFVTREGFEVGAPNVLEASADGMGVYSWTAAINGLPNGVPVNTVHFEPDFSNILWLGMDGNTTGVSLYRSIDGGATWSGYANGLPNVPVYDIAFNTTRQEAYAGTHGRGAFILGPITLVPGTSYEDALVRDVTIGGFLFDEEEAACSLGLRRADDSLCSSSTVDASGAVIRTNGDGELITELPGLNDGQPLVRACLNGTCAGGVDISACHSAQNPLKQVELTCGNETVSATLADPLLATDPPPARLLLDLDGVANAGSFGLTSTLFSPDGTSRSLCSIEVPVAVGEANDAVLARAHDLIAGDDSCQLEGLLPLLNEDDSGNDDEDEFRFDSSLFIRAPQLQGAQIFPGLQVPPGALDGGCFQVGDLGAPDEGQLLATRLSFVTGVNGAFGGSVSIIETTALGACGVTLQTQPGEDGASIAAGLEALFAQSQFPGTEACPARRNARDVVAQAEALRFGVARQVEVCVVDAGIGLRFDPFVDSLHPVASFADSIVECTDPNLTPVTLDGTASFDLDSTPGTSDDIDLHEWFEDFGGAGETLLGSGPSLPTAFAPGPHNVTLRVTDKSGLVSTATAVVSVVDTTAPELLLAHDPPLLWPPNHRLVTVDVGLQATDACSSPTSQLTLATSSEPEDLPGTSDGETLMDVQDASPGTPDIQLLLRAERDRNGNGRSYTLSYLVVDGSGNQTADDEIVAAPHDVNGIVEPMEILLESTPQGTRLDWTPVSGATAYNVVRGDLAAVAETADAFDLGSVVCIEAGSVDPSTLGDEDAQLPAAGFVFFYLVDFDDGRRSGYGTETAPKPRIPAAGDCS